MDLTEQVKVDVSAHNVAMTAADFRKMALAMKGVVEGAHHGHPDFRVNGKIMASLHSSGARGMVLLTPEQQADLVREHPRVFTPENGAWGLKGATRVDLAAVDDETLGLALTLAKGNVEAPGPSPRRRRRV